MTIQCVESEPMAAPAGPDPVVVQVQVSGPAGVLRCRCQVVGPDGVALVTVGQAPRARVALDDAGVIPAVAALVRAYAGLTGRAGR